MMRLKWEWMVVVLVLINHSWYSCCYGCWEEERIALLHLKAFFSPENGTSSFNWLEKEKEADCCKWTYKVECDPTTKRVIRLSLGGSRDWSVQNRYLNASLFLPFVELKSLSLTNSDLVGCFQNQGFEVLSPRLRNLEVLDLSFNQFNDSILSSLIGFSSLKSLNLRYNMLTGSTSINELGALSNLDELDLSHNKLKNFISPRDIIGLRKLKILNLDGNLINGSMLLQSLRALPSLKTLSVMEGSFGEMMTGQEFNNLTNLEDLFLDGSSLPNNFLQSIGGLSNLKVLSLEYCHLNGTLPDAQEFNNLTKLEELFLDGSYLPINFLQSIGGLSNLKVLSLEECHLNGTLPDAQGLCELKKLEELDLIGNRLEGVLPACLGNLSSLRLLDVSDNQFVGNIASSPLMNLPLLEYLSISSNRFRIPTISFNSFMNLSNLKLISCDNNILVAEPTSQNFFPNFQLKFFSLRNCSSKQLNVELPNFLHRQNDLRVLDLSHNNFAGMFPSWLLENNTRMEEAHLRGNLFRGPLQLPYHPNLNLTALDISHNNIYGQVPENICFILPQLQHLMMARNELTGSIPPCFGNISWLGYLDLSDNQLSRGIPDQLAMASSLCFVKLSNNNLEGEIPPAVFNLTNLFLYLDSNNFTGQISDISFNTLSLCVLDISNNHLSGKLPRWIGNTTFLQAIDLSKNHFEGSIPEEFCKLDELQYFDLSENNVAGSIPFCFNPPRISHVHLSKNLLSGPLTNAFHNSSSLVTLDLRNNSLTGSIPNWISSLSMLSVLLLKANLFNGDFPVQLCLLKQLRILDLSHNKFSGRLPSCLSKLTSKSTVETMFVTIDSEYHSTGMPRADLRRGDFYSGEFIVYQLAISGEEVVELTTKRNTYKYKGYILNFMSAIDLSCNRFTGEIPPESGNIRKIHALNLSHNNLTGTIPMTFSNLKQIESLDLSYNNLNGGIPPQLTALYTLEVFSVAFNNLSGKTPERKAQFGTFDETSYEGNPFLCGPPLRNNCDEIESPSTLMPNDSNGERQDDGTIDMDIFYITFGVSYIAVVLVIAVVLCINPHWRRAWFYFIEVCIETSNYFVLDSFHKLSSFGWP